jgi:hypothetical protein
VSRITFFLSCLCMSHRNFRTPDGDRNPYGHKGVCHRCFLALIVGTPRSSALTPPRGALLKFLSINGGHSWIYSSGTSQGPSSTFLNVDGGRSQISKPGTSQGASRRCFVALMAGAPGSTAPEPLRWYFIDVS